MRVCGTFLPMQVYRVRPRAATKHLSQAHLCFARCWQSQLLRLRRGCRQRGLAQALVLALYGHAARQLQKQQRWTT
jgi:hypothetical protein